MSFVDEWLKKKMNREKRRKQAKELKAYNKQIFSEKKMFQEIFGNFKQCLFAAIEQTK